MAKCRKLGVACPCVYLIDMDSIASSCDKREGTTTIATSVSCNDDTKTVITSNKDFDVEMEASKSYRIYMEYIHGITVKQLLWTIASRIKYKEINSDILSYRHIHEIVAKEIGRTVAKLHSAKVVHGDLTTSNMMIRMKSNTNDALDIHSILMEKLLSNTDHDINIEIVIIDFGLGKMQANVEDMAVDLYVLERAYASTHPNMESIMDNILKYYELYCTDGKSVMSKLEAVRMRGRKRDMMG